MKMRNYIVKLKGTKKNGTSDVSVSLTCVNKSQAFNMAVDLFERGLIGQNYGSKETGFYSLSDYFPNFNTISHLAGKYKVYSTSIICN